ncbi:leucine-rich repeat domain-containing protein [Nonomuraea sp. K274]|uniref:Leucine-rich repeat domain-containing protein n=2 Tax=Nonomuraea cypriaca TaxID=1187855 RepID=A0A931AE32_9ACTN|nr:leucine-rich repeat domain-containing protein [Nonomuraea cypriaca]
MTCPRSGPDLLPPGPGRRPADRSGLERPRRGARVGDPARLAGGAQARRQPPARLDRFAYLGLTDNRLTRLPETIGRMGSLVELRLYNNRLEALPESIGGLRRLRELHLQGNRLTRLPASIADLDELRVLDLRDNHLREVPDTLPPGLRHLDLRNNRLRDLPATLPPLEKLDLRWNKLDNDPKVLRGLRERGCVILR